MTETLPFRGLAGRLGGLLLPVALLLLLALPGPGRAQGISAKELSRFLDRLYRSETSQGVVEMTIVSPHYTRRLEMRIWTRGMDYTLIRILSPAKEKGTATLKRGSEMWNYLPKIGKTIRIPPSMMMSAWMGSDLTNDDLVKETTWENDYHVDLVADPPPGRVGLVYVPKEDAAVTWSKVVAFVDARTKLPLSQEYYDEKGRKVRLMDFKEVRDLGGRTIPSRMVITPLSEDKEGRRTEMIYRELAFDQPLPDSLFSLSNLRRGE